MADDLSKLCKKASELILSYPRSTRIRVISHYDADGITSAAIICKALYRSGYDFHATLMRNPFDKGLAKVSKEDNELIIFLDMGSGQIDTIEEMKCKSIIIDHHQFLKKKTSENVLQINANLCGINGNYEACGATFSYTLAKALDSKNEDLVPLAIAGVTGDKQYIGGIRGFNKTVLDESIKNGFLRENIEIKLDGDSLFDALYYSVDPYYSGISGNGEGILELLKKLKLKKNMKIGDLDDSQKRQLQSFLMLILIKKGCEKNILDTVIRPRYFSDLLKCELERFADLLDSCGKGGNRGLGLAICMDDKNAFNEAVELEKDYKQKILNELLKFEKDGFKEKKGYRYFYSRDSSLGGVIGGIATNFILDKEKPLISIVKKDDEIHVSCRGNQYLVDKGLDLGFAMNEAAKKLNGHGGGHKIASGATISSDKEKEFLEIVDEIIVKQLKG
ncbi:MAG: DHH family phosphoesterase [Thermoplasmatales archaeon]|nr:MAG: DHH family phosphoesterase [Thermoplasmatales archaeon]